MTRRTILRRLGGLIAAAIGVTRASSASAPATAPTAPLDLDTKAKAAQSRVPADLPYPRITVPGDRALAEWERLRSAGRGWPVIVGGDEQLAAIAEQYSLDDPAPTPEAILKQAATLRMPADLAKWDGTDDPRDPPLGTWPTQPTKGADLTVASDILTGKPHPQVHILLIPTTQSWEVPAYLPGQLERLPAPGLARRRAEAMARPLRHRADRPGWRHAQPARRPTSDRPHRRAGLGAGTISLLSRRHRSGRREPVRARRDPDGRRLVVLLVGLSGKSHIPARAAMVAEQQQGG